LTPLIAKHIKNAAPVSKNPGEQSLWKGGMGVKWLKNSIDAYPVSPGVSNVVITIGSNGGFNLRDNIEGLFDSLKKKFPNAKFIVIQGSWGWGGNKGITLPQVQNYYKKFSEQGGIVVDPPIGYSATDREAHQDRPVLAQVGKVVDGLIPRSSSPSTSTYISTSTPTAPTIVQSETGIIYRPGDPYRYKVVNDHWLAKKDNQSRWFEITGADYKPQFQSSIDILDRENPNSRSSKAPQRNVSGGSSTVIKTQADVDDDNLIPPSGQGKDPESLDSSISKEFNFHLIPDGKGTNYRSAQFTPDIMRKMLPKYGIKNVIRFNGDGADGKHLKNHPSTSSSTEEKILKELGINYYKLSSRKNQKEVNRLLKQGNTLIHCAHGADRTGGNVGGYFYDEKPNASLATTEAIWKYTTKYNGWNRMALKNPSSFSDGYLQQAQKFGVKDLDHAQELARKYSK